ncbi:MAG: large protein, partial [Verrucomicrobiales bacterium]|nr:large protein [Verrucomicrobiales bacterium]
MHRSISLLWAFAILLLNPPCRANSRIATAKATYASLQFAAATSNSPEYGSILTQWTTYDGTNSFPLVQASGNTYLVSGEFIPGPNDTYVADYLSSGSSGFVEYGGFTLSVPFIDNDRDGIADLLQPERSISISVSGLMNADAPYSRTYGWSGTLSRAAGSLVGSYSLTRIDAFNDVMSGTWQIGVSSGAMTYDRNNNSLRFDLVSKVGTTSITNSGSTTFTVLNNNQISLPEFVLVSSASGTRLTNLPSLFQRTGNTYVGNVTLRDGAPVTYWPDYTQVRMVLVDTNDLDSNGIPDLSDIWGDPPVVQSEPEDLRSNIGDTVTFAASVTGSSPLQLQWFYNGSPLAGKISATLQISNVQLTNAGVYTLTASNKYDKTVSRAAALAVNRPPTISLISPSDQASFTEGDQITLTANVQDQDGAISKVEFYDGGTLIGTVTAMPYSMQRSFSVGVHTVSAKVTDDGNAAVASSPVAFTVLKKNQVPTVSIVTPLTGAVFLTNQPVTTLATAFDPDGPIAQVQFALNGAVVATTMADFTTTFTNLAPGRFVLTAIAYDTRGGSSTSAPVSFSMVFAPRISSLTRLGTNVNVLATATGGIAHVLEYSTDLTHWTPVATN